MTCINYFIKINNVSLITDKKHILFTINFNCIDHTRTYYGEKYINIDVPVNNSIFSNEEILDYYKSAEQEYKSIEGLITIEDD